MFNVRSGAIRRTTKRKAVLPPPYAPWIPVGLGAPTTLWYGLDQVTGLAPFRTRYGAPWSVVDTGAGSINLDATGWGPNSGPIVQMAGGGAAVELGLSCPGAASNATNLQFDFTWACPVKFPAAFGSLQLPFVESDGDVAATNSRVIPMSFASATTYQVGGTIEAVSIVPPATAPIALAFNTTTVRYGLLVSTSQVRGGNRVWQTKIRTSGGNLDVTSGSIVNAAVSSPLDNFVMGYRPIPPATFASSDLGFGGGIRWSVGASDAQLDAILDTWATFYPL